MCSTHSVGGLFSLETISFVVQKLSIIWSPICPFFSLSYWAAGVLLRKSLPIPIISRVFPALSYTNFRVSGLKLRSLIHVELKLVQGDKHGFSFSFMQTDNLSKQHLLNRLPFIHHIFLAPFQK
jgi:hypothetical protein